jgi:glycosyltransferase involved in cell wall biosynthesis
MKLSIITINLNNLNGLKLTYQSIENQVSNNIEWIVVDGGSIDGSIEFVENLKRRPDKFISEKDNGIYHAMNKGALLSTGEFLIFMNSGDQLVANLLTDNFLTKLTADITYGDAFVTYDNLELKYSKQPVSLGILHFYRSCICHQATFIKREIQLRYKYDENYKFASCRKFFLESIVFGGVDFEYLNLPICVYDLNGVSSRAKEKLNQEEDIYISKFLSTILIKDLNEYYSLNRIRKNSKLWKIIENANDFRRKKFIFEKIVIFISKIFHF